MINCQGLRVRNKMIFLCEIAPGRDGSFHFASCRQQLSNYPGNPFGLSLWRNKGGENKRDIGSWSQRGVIPKHILGRREIHSIKMTAQAHQGHGPRCHEYCQGQQKPQAHPAISPPTHPTCFVCGDTEEWESSLAYPEQHKDHALDWGGDALLVLSLFYRKLTLLPAAPGPWCAQRKIRKMLLLSTWQTTVANSLEKWRILKGSAK